ncbi:MAG: type II toxin-antitoxin system HigB family toxin [Rhodanobacter sp.]
MVFNIKGSDYRLIVAATHRFQATYIKFIALVLRTTGAVPLP